MNRLTRKSENNAIHDYEPTEYGNDLDRIDLLGEYEDLEEQGLLIKLPCKVGTKVYATTENCPTCKDKCDWDEGDYNKNHCRNSYIKEIDFQESLRKHIGKWLFLTREEAEKALKESEEK